VLDLILWPMKDPSPPYPAWEVPARTYGSPMLYEWWKGGPRLIEHAGPRWRAHAAKMQIGPPRFCANGFLTVCPLQLLDPCFWLRCTYWLRFVAKEVIGEHLPRRGSVSCRVHPFRSRLRYSAANAARV
jgi:hypothetical protein